MQKIYECDLHGHTNRSDGNDTPAEYICHAAKRGVKIVAITDHDMTPPSTVEENGVQMSIEAYAEKYGIQVIKGIEISCQTYIDDVHLVCFGCDWEHPWFRKLEKFTIKSKIDGYRSLVEALDRRGMAMSWQEVLDNNGHPVIEEMVQKKMIFELMARKGYMPSWKEAKLFVKNSKDIQIKRKKPDAVEVIRQIHAMGGIVILAHPHLISPEVSYRDRIMTREEFIQILINEGLDGIEACYTYDKTSYGGTMTKEEIEQKIISDYSKLGLIISGGSDYHADGKKGIQNPREIGECGISIEEFMKSKKLAALIK